MKMNSDMIISADEFSALLSKYNANAFSELKLQGLSRSTDCRLNITRVIQQDFYIQCALCDMLFTGDSQVQLSIPFGMFCQDACCAVFESVTMLTVREDIVTIVVRKPAPEAIRFISDPDFTESLHPLLRHSVSYFQHHGKISGMEPIIFMRYCDATAVDLRNDPLTAAAKAQTSSGMISVPTYMPWEELGGLLMGYSRYFDDIILVGHMQSETMICHAAACFLQR